MKGYRTIKRGFTLVEILIVVIILGILAAIVIPQFTNASQDARKNSLTSQLQTVRSQVELYKLQHLDQLPPALAAGGAAPGVWVEMTSKTDADHTISATGKFGPYLQASPVNPLNNNADVALTTADYGSGGGTNTLGSSGFLLNVSTGKIWATSAQFGFVFNEGDTSDTNNDQ
jgi:general secretion pathway protein G